ncbi:MAG: hypothetical protein US76_02130 [Parcubacteria group bacterium GW2011_GWA2_38_13b]|nr:MAG: hypothetical protein US76_02130 [Parcubacteria group bacterium GW2011_GWA2_38_13b]
MKFKNIILAFLFVSFFILIGYAASGFAMAAENATIYYSQYCTGCSEYKNELIDFLKNNGFREATVKDYISDNESRLELKNRIEKAGIPVGMEGHLMIFAGDKIILGGHVPFAIVSDLFKQQNDFEKIYVRQDEMHGDAKYYEIWGFRGEVKKYPIDAPVTEYLNELKSEAVKNLPLSVRSSFLLPTILVSGFIDGINPCAIAVLIFFVAFLFSLRRSFRNIFLFGAIYIIVIYLTYLGIGLGLLKAITISGYPHLMAKVGSWLMIILGIVNLKDFFWAKLPLTPKMPHFSQGTIKYWLEKATLPAVVVGAFLVGLCTFPCSGGIYVAIVGLLAAKTTFFMGLMYLLIYNVMFVAPLVILLFGVANRPALATMARLHQRSEKLFNLFFGVTMILLGVIILIFFV